MQIPTNLYKSLRSLTNPYEILQILTKPGKFWRNLANPNETLQILTKPYKSLPNLTNPYETLQIRTNSYKCSHIEKSWRTLQICRDMLRPYSPGVVVGCTAGRLLNKSARTPRTLCLVCFAFCSRSLPNPREPYNSLRDLANPYETWQILTKYCKSMRNLEKTSRTLTKPHKSLQNLATPYETL